MAEFENDSGENKSPLTDPREKDPPDKPGIEEAAEPRDIERPGDARGGRLEQMQNADNSNLTEETVESARVGGSAAKPEVGLPSEAENRSDEL